MRLNSQREDLIWISVKHFSESGGWKNGWVSSITMGIGPKLVDIGELQENGDFSDCIHPLPRLAYLVKTMSIAPHCNQFWY